MLLLTWHGTVVGLREGGGGLVQLAPGEASPGVTLLDLDLPAVQGTEQRRLQSSLGPLTVGAAPGGRGLTLARYGSFLCAELPGPDVAFDRGEASTYETFLPLTDRSLADLTFLLGHAWTEAETEDGRAPAPQRAELGPGFWVRLGGRQVDLAQGLPQRAVTPATPGQPPPTLTFEVGGRRFELAEADVAHPAPGVAPRQEAAVPVAADSPAADTDLQAELTSWALAELAFWRLNPVSVAQCEEVWASLNRTVPHLFLFHFHANTVTLVEKPGTMETSGFHLIRANAYLDFFRTVAARLAPACDFKVAMGLGDRLLMDAGVPLFCFQKTRGARTILVPDIDFLASGFHEGENVRDTWAFHEKADSAIFVGGTTGGEITEEIARTCSLPRLRAACFFDGHPRIGFFLPSIVQCRTAEAERILQEMPFCREQRVSWQEQFTKRFLISMDGNGATCSRVAIALRSNSVLLKYASPEILYYFHGLQEWLHYVPVEQDRDVEKLLDLEQWSPRSPEEIARAGRHFAERFLTRERVTEYAVTLFTLYAGCFTGQAAARAAIAPPAATRREPSSTMLAIIAHVQNVGDRPSDQTGWAGSPETSHPIEGFQLSRIDRLALEGVACQGVRADGSLTPAVSAGGFCGTRGKSTPLFGYVLTAAERPDSAGTITCEARFADGSNVGPVDLGEVCHAPSGAPLTAMRICLNR